MEQCWRWFGPDDPISLQKIAQAGATGVVTALHHIETGAEWPLAEIRARFEQIEAAGLRWSVVESVPVHRDIQTGGANRDALIGNYQRTIRNLGESGIPVICYNFMPVLDWTRTSLDFRLPNGAEALRFDVAQFAAYDVHMLERKDAQSDYSPEVLRRAQEIFDASSEEDLRELEQSIIAGLPGGEGSYEREELRAELESFQAIGEVGLRENLKYFLRKVVPVAAECGIRMAIHPDDPPFSLFGLPRVVSTADDVRDLFNSIEQPENGLTLCAGSFGARGDNDLSAIAEEFGERVHFVHLRNVARDGDGSFHESDHLDGDNDLVELISVLLEQERSRTATFGQSSEIPMRPDHGHTIGDEIGQVDLNPGYSYQGRLKALAELRGVITTLQWSHDRIDRGR